LAGFDKRELIGLVAAYSVTDADDRSRDGYWYRRPIASVVMAPGDDKEKLGAAVYIDDDGINVLGRAQCRSY
jgi:hypothetical protein